MFTLIDVVLVSIYHDGVAIVFTMIDVSIYVQRKMSEI